MILKSIKDIGCRDCSEAGGQAENEWCFCRRTPVQWVVGFGGEIFPYCEKHPVRPDTKEMRPFAKRKSFNSLTEAVAEALSYQAAKDYILNVDDKNPKRLSVRFEMIARAMLLTRILHNYGDIQFVGYGSRDPVAEALEDCLLVLEGAKTSTR